MKYYLFLHKICKNILFFLFFCKTNREINKKQIAQSHNRATKYHLVIIHSLKAKSMLFDRNKLLTDYVPIVLQSEKTYTVKVPTIMMR